MDLWKGTEQLSCREPPQRQSTGMSCTSAKASCLPCGSICTMSYDHIDCTSLQATTFKMLFVRLNSLNAILTQLQSVICPCQINALLYVRESRARHHHEQLNTTGSALTLASLFVSCIHICRSCASTPCGGFLQF